MNFFARIQINKNNLAIKIIENEIIIKKYFSYTFREKL